VGRAEKNEKLLSCLKGFFGYYLLKQKKHTAVKVIQETRIIFLELGHIVVSIDLPRYINRSINEKNSNLIILYGKHKEMEFSQKR